MRDPYSVLGVSKDADEKAIKSAYRRMAKKYHPDSNQGDAGAKDRFAEANAAYEILGDRDRRAQFDRGEIDASGKETFKGFQGGGFGGGDPFGGFKGFGGFARRGGASAGGDNMSAEDILSEIFKQHKFDGANEGGPFAGGGAGRAQARAGAGRSAGQPPKGADVQGVAQISLEDIAAGRKVRVSLPNGKTVDAKIPAGATEGQTIRLKGLGATGPTGAVGDALIKIEIRPHTVFKRDGDNLRLEVPVTLYEAVLGAKVKIPTLSGKVQISIPPGTSSGKSFRIKGKGLPKASGGEGDIYASVKIMLPDSGDSGLEALMRDWQDVKPYRVRGEEFD